MGGDTIAVSVHGALGVLDLLVPAGADVADVAREYLAQAGLPAGTPPPTLHTRLGDPLAGDVTLAEAGVSTGAVLVAPGGPFPPPAAGREPGVVMTEGRPEPDDGPAGLAVWVAAAAALLSGWLAARIPEGEARTTAVWVLGAATLLAVLPVGRFGTQRALVAPAFGFAATYALVWDPAPERTPAVLGVAALVAAVVAAAAYALREGVEMPLRVWMIAGVVCFLVSTGAALAGFAPSVVWAVLLVVAMLAARFVPLLAIDVPDQYLIDIERLAVTAWTAREQPRGRRGRIIVPRQAVTRVAERGTRTLVASAAAVLAVTAVSAPMLLATARLPVDRIGAWCLVGFAGAALLLVARSYRHTTGRLLLRLAGLGCLAALVVALAPVAGPTSLAWVVTGSVAVAALLVVVAVAVGRGWRSAWWSRRAEVAEGLCGAFALGSVVVAVGLFRRLWELTGQGLGG